MRSFSPHPHCVPFLHPPHNLPGVDASPRNRFKSSPIGHVRAITMSTKLHLNKVLKTDREGTEAPAISSDDSDCSSSIKNDQLERPSKKARRSPHDDDEHDRLEAKRAYNRMNSARNRKRQKELIATLKEQLEAVNHRLAEAARQNDLLLVQMRLLEQENQTMALKHHFLASNPSAMRSLSTVGNLVSPAMSAQVPNDSLLGRVQTCHTNLPGAAQLPIETLMALKMLHR